MKKKFYIALVAVIIAANGFFAFSPAQANENPVELTCYSSWSETVGDQSFVDCLTCTRISFASGKSDPGTCSSN